MSRLRPFRARVGVAGAASLAALSLLVTSLTPLAMRASAADESAQSPDVATSQEAAMASSNSEAVEAPAAELPPVSWTSKLKSREWEAFRVCGSGVEA